MGMGHPAGQPRGESAPALRPSSPDAHPSRTTLPRSKRSTGLHLDELREDEDEEDRRIAGVIRRIAAMATGRLQILREMRELDDRLGLTPKSLAALRWTIVADAASTPTGPTPPTPATKSATDRKLRLIGNGSNG
jgi:hypothetical protein